MADVVEVLQHWQAGASIRQLATSLGMGRVRLRRLLAVVEAAGLSPGGPPLTRAELEQRVPELFAMRIGPPESEQEQRIRRLHDQVLAGLETNTVTTVWQRLHDEQGLDVSLSTFRRYVRAHVRTVRPEDVTVRREPTPPGQVAEIDYGFLGRWLNPRTGKRHSVHAFVLTLAFSRRSFALPVLRCDQEAWTLCHVAAFQALGGAPHQIRLDNLKTGVLKADIYDPQLNHAYAELAHHYGVLLDPCRAAKPKDKPQVERAVPYVRESFWKGRDFRSLDEMIGGGVRWMIHVGDKRPHRHLPGTVGEVFARIEAPALLPLPAEPFEVAHWAKAKLHPDCHVQVHRTFYSAPWQLVGRQLDVRVGERVVRIYDGGQLVRTHVRQRGQRRYTDCADIPEQKIAFLQRTPQWCRRRAAELGPAVTALVDDLLVEPWPLSHLRQAQAVLRLADTHPAERLNAACRVALDTDGSYRTVRTLLEKRRLDADDEPHASAAGAFLHGQQTLLEGLS